MNPGLSLLIKNEAKRLGFTNCGIAHADFLSVQEERLVHWLEKKQHSGMHYMEKHLDKRLDPRLLFEEAKSIVSVTLNYYTEDLPNDNCGCRISKYAYGNDYHFVLKEKLQLLMDQIRQLKHDVQGKIFVDSAPVMEKVWAEKAGIGWIGKNTILINKQYGSFQFLGEIILDIELEYDKVSENHCGNCSLCLDACPTNALSEPYMLDAGKCLSYKTIESEEEMTDYFIARSNGWVFGCDICQDVCPWNKEAKLHQVKEFEPLKETVDLINNGCDSFSKDTFKAKFGNSALSRVNYDILCRNEEKYLHFKKEGT
jgi:epoxyqueuosine reductase